MYEAPQEEVKSSVNYPPLKGAGKPTFEDLISRQTGTGSWDPEGCRAELMPRFFKEGLPQGLAISPLLLSFSSMLFV